MAQQANHALPSGFQLNEYRIEHQLSLGGFSIVYLATNEENQFVAIKEYLPNSLALRAEGEIKPAITEEHMPAFRYGMKCFFVVVRALAQLSHPNVIRVLNFFRANGNWDALCSIPTSRDPELFTMVRDLLSEIAEASRPSTRHHMTIDNCFDD